MKAILTPRSGGRFPEASGSPTPSSSQKHRPPRIPKENLNPNPDSSPFHSPAFAACKPFGVRNRSPLPPRPPSHGAKKKLCLETIEHGAAPSVPPSDSGVQVILRMRPLSKDDEEGNLIAEKISENSISVLDQTITFDAIADMKSTQSDIFRLVGLPLVENCLDGFNSSIFAYGQTGSGKTYTMWGPLSAFSADSSLNSEQGLTPRVFERLFCRIEEEQAKNSDKQQNFQCRCSFLEIYNEQITDLLYPTQRSLQIREDAKTGVYVEGLTEEYVCTMKDVIQLLVKGLANRRTGPTSINLESSRSHCVFTCIVESRYKSVIDGLISLKTSRINLVDLAGSERQKQTGAAGERLKEAGNINRSLSQLGNLINILAEISQSGKQRHIPYRDSRLTFLLQESLGGNAKLAMICAISPSKRCKNETISTLRFAQRAKVIKNKAVVNETKQDDVCILREQIRQLKDEILRMKSNESNVNKGSFSTVWNARRSLSLLKMSIRSPTFLPAINDDSDEEMEIDENDVEMPITQAAGPMPSSDLMLSSSDKVIAVPERQPVSVLEAESNLLLDKEQPKLGQSCSTSSSSDNLIVPCQLSADLQSPTLRTSPVHETYIRKSLRSSKQINKITGTSCPVHDSFSKEKENSPLSTEDLAVSLHRGLQIIDAQRCSAIVRRSSFKFSTVDTVVKSMKQVNMIDAGVQTEIRLDELEDSVAFTCRYCKKMLSKNESDVKSNLDLQLIPIDGSQPADKLQIQVPRAVEKVLAGSIRREMALEEHCEKQYAEIAQLDCLVQQYKHERECSAMIAQEREDKISRLERLMDGTLPTGEFTEEEFISLANEHKLLKEKYENHTEITRLNVELKRVQEELDGYKNFFQMGERDVLIEEIQDLRSQLQYYMDSSSKPTCDSGRLLLLAHSDAANLAVLPTIPEVTEESANENVNSESCSWSEKERNWISLCEDLKVQLEASRSHSEKLKLELDTEKKCAEEMKEALQTAMQGHVQILEQYTDLQEKYTDMLAMNRKISEGIEDVKKDAARAGVKGAESKFINSLATEISVLRAEIEKERRYWRDENTSLQAQVRDTAEAVQAAGELLVRLKEAEEAAAIAEKRALMAEEETEKLYQEIDKLKKNYDTEITLLTQVADSNLPKGETGHTEREAPKDDVGSISNKKWSNDLEPFCSKGDVEYSKDTDPNAWFSGYDRCNI